MEGGAEGVVVGRLVRESATRRVHHDRARLYALAVDHPRDGLTLGVGDVDGGDPPRLLHVADRRTHPHGHLEAVAGVGLDRHGTFQRSADEVADHLGVPLEPASGQHNAGGGCHLTSPVGGLEPHTGDAVVVLDQADRAVARAGLDPAVEARLQ